MQTMENPPVFKLIESLQERLSYVENKADFDRHLQEASEWALKNPTGFLQMDQLMNPAFLFDLQQRLQKLNRTAGALAEVLESASFSSVMPPLRPGHLSLVSHAIAVRVTKNKRKLIEKLFTLLRDSNLASRYGPVKHLQRSTLKKATVNVTFTCRDDATAALAGINGLAPSDSDVGVKLTAEWVISGNRHLTLSCGIWVPSIGCTYVPYSRLPGPLKSIGKLLCNSYVDPRSINDRQVSNQLNLAAKCFPSLQACQAGVSQSTLEKRTPKLVAPVDNAAKSIASSSARLSSTSESVVKSAKVHTSTSTEMSESVSASALNSDNSAKSPRKDPVRPVAAASATNTAQPKQKLSALSAAMDSASLTSEPTSSVAVTKGSLNSCTAASNNLKRRQETSDPTSPPTKQILFSTTTLSTCLTSTNPVSALESENRTKLQLTTNATPMSAHSVPAASQLVLPTVLSTPKPPQQPFLLPSTPQAQPKPPPPRAQPKPPPPRAQPMPPPPRAQPMPPPPRAQPPPLMGSFPYRPRKWLSQNLISAWRQPSMPPPPRPSPYYWSGPNYPSRNF